jgi:dTDP-4-amino-4,6-dideoxygalactose transaminase
MRSVPFLDLGRLHAPIRERLDAACRRVVDSGWFIMGPELEAFEAEFARYCGVEYCVGVGNGLEAIHLLLRAYGIGPGDEVIVPSHVRRDVAGGQRVRGDARAGRATCRDP